MKKQNWVQKSLMFHTTNEYEMNVYRLLDKVRYSQSHLVIKLLDDFFKEYELDENTPYDHFLFVINSYIDSNNSDMLAKSQAMNMIAMKKFQSSQGMLQTPMSPFPFPYPVMMPQQMIPHPSAYGVNPVQAPVVEEKEITESGKDLVPSEPDENDAFLDSLASGFGSMLD